MKLQNKLITIFSGITLYFVLIALFSFFELRSIFSTSLENEISNSGNVLKKEFQEKEKILKAWLNFTFENNSTFQEKLKETEKRFSFWKEKKIPYLKENWGNLAENKPPLSLFFHNSLSRYLLSISPLSPIPIEKISIYDGDGFLIAFTKKPKNFLFSPKAKEFINISKSKVFIILPIHENSKIIGFIKLETELEKLFENVKNFSPDKNVSAHIFLGNNLVFSSYMWKKNKKMEEILKSKNYIVRRWDLDNVFSFSHRFSLVIIGKKREMMIFHSILVQLILVLSGLIFIGTILYFRIILPIRKIEKSAHGFATSKFSNRTFIGTGDELESLSHSLNSIADRIEENLKEIRESKKIIKEEKEKKFTFTFALSHELRTPLSVIENYANLLSSGNLGEIKDEQKKGLENIRKYIQYLLHLVDNLLNFSRLESGKWEISLNKFLLRSLLEKVRKDFLPSAKKKGIEISLKLPSHLPPIYSDSFALQIIMNNLVENSIKFTPEGGKIIIKADKKDNSIKIEIEDTGIGFSEEEIEKIFKPFYRVDTPEARKGWGTGLGLSISSLLIELLKGKIEVRNREKGGSIFTVILPLK